MLVDICASILGVLDVLCIIQFSAISLHPFSYDLLSFQIFLANQHAYSVLDAMPLCDMQSL